jgi:O-methyltransferase
VKQQFKRAILTALTLVGAGELARRVGGQLRARGLRPWRPLIPVQQFTDCVRRSITALREAGPGDPIGAYLEFGVSRGTSLACVDRVLRQLDLPDVRLIGFDSFEGMPPESEEEGWKPGQFHSTLAATRRYLAGQGVDLARVELVKGWFSETLTEATRERLAIGRASLIMVDCDIYSASKAALEFSEPHIHQRAVIMLDDWGWRAGSGKVGQQEAFAEFLTAHPDLHAEPLPAYLPQARVFLVTRTPAPVTASVPSTRSR